MFRTLKLIKDVDNDKDKLNILTFNTHERYQTQLAKTGHNFYAFNYDGGKDWFDGHGHMPSNYYQLPKNSIYPGLDIDLILVQSKFGQFQIAQQINQQLQLPVVVLEHTLPLENWPESQLTAFQSMTGDANVFITKSSRYAWSANKGAPKDAVFKLLSADVIYHSIDTEVFRPDPQIARDDVILTVAHNFIERDYALNYHGWKRITEGLPTRVVGDTPGLSQQSRSLGDLIKEYQKASVYVNTTTLSPIPMSMLEAMACGCAIVTTETCDIPRFIKNGENGFISNDEMKLKKYLTDLINNPTMARTMGEKARETILKEFPEDKFIEKWNKVFFDTLEKRK